MPRPDRLTGPSLNRSKDQARLASLVLSAALVPLQTRGHRIGDGLTPTQQIKTLAHELAHAILHGDGFDGTRELRELEAESVAYIVCDGLELDSSEYSFGYVTS